MAGTKVVLGLLTLTSLFPAGFAHARTDLTIPSLKRCKAYLARSTLPSASKVDLVREAVRGYDGKQGYRGLLDLALPLTKDFTAEERIAFATQSWVNPEVNRRHWVAMFIFDHLLKTRAEDPLHGLTGDQILSLVPKLDSEASYKFLEKHSKFFPVLNREELQKAKQIFFDKHPVTLRFYGEVFQFSDAEKVDIFRRNAGWAGANLIEHSRFGRYQGKTGLRSRYAHFLELPESKEIEIVRHAFAEEPLRSLGMGAFAEIPPIGADTPLEAKNGMISIRSVVEQIAQKYPEVIQPAEASLLWDRVKNIEVGFRLFQSWVKISRQGLAPPKTSLDLLGLAMGFDVDMLREVKLSDRQASQLYEVSLDLGVTLDTPPFHRINLDRNLWQPDQIGSFLGALSDLRDLNHIRGNHQRAWAQTVDHLGLGRGLGAEGLPNLRAQVRQLIVQELENVFEGAGISIARRELDDLYSRWGSIEPITTLVARFKGNPKWVAEIPLFGEVLESVMKNRFDTLKYKGIANDIADETKTLQQLKVLADPNIRAEWMINRERVSLYDPNISKIESDSSRLSRARREVETSFLHNIANRSAGPRLEETLKNSLLDKVVAAKNAPSPRELSRLLGIELSALEQSLVQLLQGAVDVISMKKIATYLKGNASLFRYSDQTQLTLVEIIATLTPPKTSPSSIVFTTTFDHPKMLLTIGDLVDTSSCQNYKNGGHIETLLGYVVDADVKGIAAYILRPANFSDHRHFMELSDALTARTHGQSIRIDSRMDGDNGVVHFKISQEGSSERVISTLPLRKAQLRRVMKLGETDSGKAGIVLERSYEQADAARSEIIKHVQELEQEVAKAIGGVTGQRIRISGSRNPGGVYSDAAGGTQQGSYQIYPVLEQ